MKILVINSGSSSIKCQYFIDGKSHATGAVDRIGEANSVTNITSQGERFSRSEHIADHNQALLEMLELLKESGALTKIDDLDAVGHRVVHGGAAFDRPTLITPEVIDTLRSLIPLAPLHNPANLEGITVMQKLHPNMAQVAVFDTAFHQTMPDFAYLYPLPYRLYEEERIRKYGFHGTSHAFVAKEAARLMDKRVENLNLITLHLGNGASATAIRSGKSVDTSMGFTPLEGLMMGTRCGDIDPAIIPFVSHNLGLDIDAIDTILNKESGLRGICGSNDMREVIQQANQGDKRSGLALKMYVHRIKKYIGSYIAILGRVDAIIFTGGIGEHAALIREMVCEGFEESFGIALDAEKNNQPGNDARSLNNTQSRIALYVIPTNEELEIALQTQALLA